MRVWEHRGLHQKTYALLQIVIKPRSRRLKGAEKDLPRVRSSVSGGYVIVEFWVPSVRMAGTKRPLQSLPPSRLLTARNTKRANPARGRGYGFRNRKGIYPL